MNDDNGVTYFFGQGANAVGIYATTGGYPKKLSRPIQKWIEAIDPAYYENIAGYTDGTKVVWAIGSVTIDGITYTNTHLAYNISDQSWEMYNYADRFNVFAGYITSTGAMTILGGDTDGYVQTIGSGTTDNGTPIYSECEFAPVVFIARARRKSIPAVMTFAKNFQGLTFHMKTDDGEFHPLGSIDATDKVLSGYLPLKGNRFFPKITCVNSGTPFIFEGFCFTEIADEGYAQVKKSYG